MIKKMGKVIIYGAKGHFDKVVSLLHELGVLHIQDLSDSAERSPYFNSMQSTPIRTEEKKHFDEGITRMEALLSVLPEAEEDAHHTYDDWYGKYAGVNQEDVISRLSEDVGDIEKEVGLLVRRRGEVETELASLSKYERILERIQPLLANLSELEGFNTVAVIIRRDYSDVISVINRELERITSGQFEMISAIIDEESLAAVIIYPKRHVEAINKLVLSENINELKLPPDLRDKPAKQALELIKEKEEGLPRELDELGRRLDEFAAKDRVRFRAIRDALGDRSAEIGVLNQFGETSYTFIINGWVPHEKLAQVEKTLQEEFKGEVASVILPVSPDEYPEVPIAFYNWRPFRMFEWLVTLLSPPRYGTVDPTPFLALFFPIFFGLILGDAGYGIILFGLAWFLRRRYKSSVFIQRAAPVLMVAAFSSFVFGIVYGEFLGTLGEHYFGLHPYFNRLEGMFPFMIFAVALGFSHVLLGLGLGVANAWRMRNLHHVYEKASLIVFLIGLFFVVAVLANLLPGGFMTPAVAVLIVSLVVLLVFGGGLAILELQELFVNILSYTRIMAIGVSAVLLAMLANEFAGLIGNIFLGVIVAVLVHILSIALGVLSPTIQSLRLHYVEFFSKFYESGKVVYSPFHRRKGAR